MMEAVVAIGVCFMRRIVFLFIIICVCSTGDAALAAHGHHFNGFDGIGAGSPPPEGFYWRMYNVHYTANQLKDNKGKKIPGDFRTNMFVVANSFIYSTPVKILGGNLWVQAVIPMIHADISYEIYGIKPDVLNDRRFNLGDIVIDPLLVGWHGERWEAVAGVGMYMPTGEFKANKAASPGKGFWTIRNTLGGTVYFDKEKSWSASIQARYEIHTEQRETRTTPGHDFHFDWGVGKSFFNKLFTVGAAGFCSWQVTKDTGKNVANDYREQAFGIGPEIGFIIPEWLFLVNLRVLKEFGNKNTMQGVTTALIFTKVF